MKQKTAVVVGASSGIGEALARELVQGGYHVGICARRMDKLEALRAELGEERVHALMLDVNDTAQVTTVLEQFKEKLGHIDAVFNGAGIGLMADELDIEQEIRTMHTNVCGFMAVSLASYKLFKAQQYGHMVGISSIAALRGSPDAPAYFASKAAVSSYMEGLHLKTLKDRLPIYITDVRPGFVDTAMAQGEGMFWVAEPKVAAQQIISAMNRKKKIAYVTKRWALIACVLKIAPKCLLAKFM